MGSLAAARDMQAQGNKRSRIELRVVEGGKRPNGKRLPLGEAAMRLPGMNGFGVERPMGLKQKMVREKEPKGERGPEQGRRYKDPNWWQHERMMM